MVTEASRKNTGERGTAGNKVHVDSLCNAKAGLGATETFPTITTGYKEATRPTEVIHPRLGS